MAEFNVTLFSQRLKEARMKRNIKQKDLAEQIGVTPQTLSNYENPSETKTKIPTTIVLMELADALGVSMDWLCGRETSEKHSPSQPTTVGGYAKALGEIVTWRKVGLAIDVEEDLFSTNASISFSDYDICKFLSHCKAFLTLRNDGAITNEMFLTMLSDRVTALDKIQKNFSNEDELPIDF